MTTRSGSIDPGAVLYLVAQLGLEETTEVLERRSGLLALSGFSGDVRELERDPRGAFALDVYAYRVAQAVAACAVALGGVDCLAFSGGIGENSARVRDAVVAHLPFLAELDVRVVPAREDIVAAREVAAFLSAR